MITAMNIADYSGIYNRKVKGRMKKTLDFGAKEAI